MDYSLSYIIVTRNRLNYLKITLTKLLCNISADEEIIVIDGNSNDGTIAYLDELHRQKKIHQFISEPDQNQAQGWNKGLLLAKGKIIKKIMDDDVFCYASIRICKNWMLDHPQTDICISNSLQVDLLSANNIDKTSRLNHYNQWKNGEKSCFSFSDVYMLIRKNALSSTGLYDTQFRMIDWEFSLRCSFLNLKIVYYTGYVSLAVQTPRNVSSLSTKKTFKNEARIAKVKYGYPGDNAETSWWSKIKIFIGTKLYKLRNQTSFIHSNLEERFITDIELERIYDRFYTQLEQENQQTNFKFIH